MRGDDNEKMAAVSAFAVLAVILAMELVGIVRLRAISEPSPNPRPSIWDAAVRQSP